MADTSAVQYLIVGGGIAGVTCAEHLSMLCPEHKIVVVTATDVIKSACNLRQFGHTLEEFDVREKPLACLSHKSPNITVIKGTVKAFNPKECFVITEAEEKLHYRKLCICSGGRPKVLSESNPHIIGIRDTDSAVDLQKRLSQAKRVIIVGNGGIALELVYEVRDCEVVWVIKDDAIGSTFFDKGAATFLLPELECDLKWAQDCDQPVVKRMKYAAVRGTPGQDCTEK